MPSMRALRTRSAGLLLAAVAACAVNPATGDRELMLVSEQREIQLGRENHDAVVQQMGLVEDEALQGYVRELGEGMAAESERPELPWAFHVVDDPAVNAFALPGGFIYVTRGILAHLGSEAELAAVLGHEIGHVTARHSAGQMSQRMVAQLGLGAATVLLPEASGVAGVAQAGLGLLFLKHGRDDEREADRLGLRYLRRTDYDPREMPGVFEMLDRVSAASGSRTPEWLSTHPAPENRHARITEQLDTIRAGGAVRRASYLDRLEGMVFGEDPRQGFFRGERFLHPEMRFRLDFPRGWKTMNARSSVVGASPDEDAIVQLTLADAPDARAAARDFARGNAVAATRAERGRIHGLRAATTEFTAATGDGGELAGTAAFIEHGDHVFRILAYAPAHLWPDRRGAARRAVRSFQPVDDPAVLNVRPQRLEIVRLDRATTIAALHDRRGAPVSVDVLARINGVDPDEQLDAGRRVKWVAGESVL